MTDMIIDINNLGDLINALEEINPEYQVYIKPYNLRPTGFDSYRGYYEDLSLTYDCDSDCMVKDLLKWAKNTINKKLLGYKGGEFLITENTPIWISNYGQVTGMKLTSLEVPFDGYVYLYGEKEE